MLSIYVTILEKTDRLASKTKFFFIALLPFTLGEANTKFHLQVRYDYCLLARTTISSSV